MKFKMSGKVWILSSKKMDGRFNRGKIVGVELSYYGLGFISQEQFFRDFDHPRYKVAYVDCVTGRACSEWFLESDLQREQPK